MSNLPSRADVDLVVFDILGTLVNEPGGLHASIRELAPSDSAGDVDNLVEVWQSYVADQQQKMLDGTRPYANSDVIDREAAELVATRCEVTDPAAIDRLATAGRRLDPWSDTIEGLERLAQRFPLVGPSNASRATLTHLNAHAGLRWHYLLSAEDAQSYLLRTSIGSPWKSPAVVRPSAFSWSPPMHGTFGAHKYWGCGRPMSGGRLATHRSPPTHSTTTPPSWTIL